MRDLVMISEIDKANELARAEIMKVMDIGGIDIGDIWKHKKNGYSVIVGRITSDGRVWYRYNDENWNPLADYFKENFELERKFNE